MDKFLGQDIPEQERWQFLQDNANSSGVNRLYSPIHTRRIGAKERNIS